MTDTAVAPAPTAGGTVPILVGESLSKRYHLRRAPRDVVDGVSLTVQPGEFVAIMGPSGCGKSTLLHMLAGLEPPDRGRVMIAGRDVYGMDDDTLSAFRRDHVGLVFQFFNLLPSLTAAENIALPLRLRGGESMRPASRRTAMTRVSALMDQLGLHNLQGHGPEDISGGEQQRVAIARALAAAPSLLLADEPTGNLDWSTGHEVMALLGRLCREEGQTTVLVTHDVATAAYAGRVLVMRDGNISAEVPLEHSSGEARAETRQLLECLNELGL